MSSGFMSNFSCSSAEGNITSYISLKGFILLIFLFLVLTKGAPTCKYCENMWTHDEKAMSCGISIPYALPESCINFLVGVPYGRCSLKFIGRQIMSRLYGGGKTCTITFFWTSWCSHSKEVMNRFSVLCWFFPTATFFFTFFHRGQGYVKFWKAFCRVVFCCGFTVELNSMWRTCSALQTMSTSVMRSCAVIIKKK